MGSKNGSALVKNNAVEVDMSVLETKMGYQVRMADRLMSKDFAQAVGMTPVQYSVFSLVATNPGLSQVAIGDSLNMDRASTMAIVRKLENAELIDCRKSLQDRRMQALHLTAKGEKEFKAVDKRVTDYDIKMSKRLTPKERQLFLECIAKLG
jgi:DNA-binding MarR family transcriptional regulator